MANVLVIGPHPDDQELGMGGTIAKLAAQGHNVLLLDVTNGEPTPFGDPVTRQAEAMKASEVLATKGQPPIRRHLLGLKNREVLHSIEARHKLAAIIRAHQADILFAPFFEDAHPDHIAVTRIAEDARFDAKLTSLDLQSPVDGWTGESVLLGDPIYPKWFFYYYATHLRWVANPSFVIDVTGYEQTKIDSINAYHTQFVLPEKNRKIVDWVHASLTYFGSRIGVPSGEAFYTREPVGLTGFDSLA
ncbi:MAG: PIG-L family deacetylase [Phycisphaerales bacterium]|nr:PIG-L family deacetylase [Phycisphaerales bacterium]MCB9836105.1 PIG-L family deacetylase [Phycisphaera sp.]